MRVALVLAGDELCEGHRQDTNGAWMARELTGLGARVEGLVTCRDDVATLTAAIRAAAATADLVVVSGGLGPTEDDRTREALAAAAGCALVHDPAALAAITATLEARGIPVRSAHHAQAQVPDGGRSLSNLEGVAPGLEVRVGDATVICLPGVPAELRGMFGRHVQPHLDGARAPATGAVFASGIGEPQVEARITGRELPSSVRIGFYPHHGEVEVRLFGTGPDAAAETADALDRIEDALGPDGFRPGPGERIEHVVVRRLRARDETVSAAESLTGGLIAEMLTRVPGASEAFGGGVVAYTNPVKEALLGVPAETITAHGVVSAEVAEALAEGVRARLDTDHGIGTTGAAGPEDWTQPDGRVTPAGRAFVAVATRGAAPRVRQLDVRSTRAVVRRRTAVAALDLLRRGLAD